MSISTAAAQRVWNLVNKGRIYEEMIQLPQVLALQEYLLGDNCILSSFTVNHIGPGAPAGRLHIDFPLGSFPQPPPPFAFCANTIYVLDDFAPENGATHIVPGSYKRGYAPDPEKEYDDVIQLDVRKGRYRRLPRRDVARQRSQPHRAGSDDSVGILLPLVYEAAARPVQASAPRGHRAGDADPKAIDGLRIAVGDADLAYSHPKSFAR